jgi:hypothetical protein
MTWLSWHLKKTAPAAVIGYRLILPPQGTHVSDPANLVSPRAQTIHLGGSAWQLDSRKTD